ncbi:unnamed protein product [Penicillium pancosmium]
MPLLQNIKLVYKDYVFADDIWKALATICKGQRIFSDAKAWTNFTGMRASDYNNVDDYTAAYVRAFNSANDAGFNIPWKGSILGYLAGVSVFNAQVADKAMRRQLFDNIRGKVKLDMFDADKFEKVQSSLRRKRRRDDTTKIG